MLARKTRNSPRLTWTSKTYESRRIEGSGAGAGSVVDFARLLPSCRKLHLHPFEHCPLASPSPLWTRRCSLWFLNKMFDSILPFQASKFRDLKFCSILLFLPLSSVCDNQVSFSSDESPHCTIQTRSWFSQTLVFLICTDFPGCHQVGIVPSIIKFRPVLYRTPEYCHSEEQPQISPHNQARNRGLQWPGSYRRSSQRYVFLEEIGLLFEPFVSPDWPFSWSKNSG